MNEEKLVEAILEQGGQTYQEAISWGLFANTAGLSIAVFVFLCLLSVCLYCWIKGGKDNWNNEVYAIGCGVSGFFSLFAFGTLIQTTFGLLQVLYYPRAYILSLM